MVMTIFTMVFHCYLNAFADLTGFADRSFYEDWWNSATYGEYWKKWNVPMHNWITRHLYFPMRSYNVPRWLAIILVFVFSGIFHEFLLACTINKITMLGFNGMVGNVPIILLQEKGEKYVSRKTGNIIFWVYFSLISAPMTYVVGYNEMMK
mmetsp:Transcript_9410/g.10628  ORF Transcript_9410/g.10628 Transcript_9410/m.10628 type:complete len:151 (+) Transcript_9410:1012-1464(+)